MTGETAEVVRLSRAAAAAAPAATLEMAKLCVLDWLGLAIAGAREPVARILAAGAEEEGARPAASVVGAGRRFSARQAALINGAAGHALDYDDVNLAMRVHPTAVLLPPLLALAETRPTTGRAVLSAFIAGYEATGVVGRWIGAGHYLRGLHATGTVGTIGAAAASAHLLGLDDAQAAVACGLAATQAAGLKAQFGTMAKPLHAGRAAETGMLAALWARAGLTGRGDVLERPQGFVAALCDPATVGDVAWSGYELDRNLFKMHATCFGTHGTLEALGRLRRDGLRPEAVRSVRLTVDRGADKMCNIARPATGMEAKFSLRFCAALALAGLDTADPAVFDDAVVALPELEGLRSRVEVGFGPADWPEDLTEAEVETLHGRLAAAHDVSRPIGPLALQRERLQAKFRILAGPHLPPEHVDRLIAAADAFDELADAGEVMRLLAPPH